MVHFYAAKWYIFTPALTLAESGVLSEYVWALPEAKRSPSPMHSHLAVGSVSDILLKSRADYSFVKDSDFDLMHKASFYLLLLGTSFTVGAIFVHQVETMVGVPYRSWLKLFRRVAGEDGTIRNITFRYYGRELNSPWK